MNDHAHDHDEPRPSRPRARRAVEVLTVAAAVALVVTAGIAVLRPDPPEFCDRVAELRSIASVGDDGTPAGALRADAVAYTRVADVAPDETTAGAARTFADHQRALADAVAGSSSSVEVVDQVLELDTRALERARVTLDDQIAQRCG